MAGSVVFVVFLFLSMTTFSPANWLTLAMYRFLVLCHVVSFMLFFSAKVSATLRRRWRFLIHWGGRGVGKEVGSSCLLGVGEGLPGEGFSCSEDLLDRTGPAVPGRGVNPSRGVVPLWNSPSRSVAPQRAANARAHWAARRCPQH